MKKIDDTAQYSPNDRFIMQSLTLSNTLVKPCYHMARAALSTLVETLEENKKEAKVNAFTNGCRKDSQYQSFADSAKASTELFFTFSRSERNRLIAGSYFYWARKLA